MKYPPTRKTPHLLHPPPAPRSCQSQPTRERDGGKPPPRRPCCFRPPGRFTGCISAWILREAPNKTLQGREVRGKKSEYCRTYRPQSLRWLPLLLLDCNGIARKSDHRIAHLPPRGFFFANPRSTRTDRLLRACAGLSQATPPPPGTSFATLPPGLPRAEGAISAGRSSQKALRPVTSPSRSPHWLLRSLRHPFIQSFIPWEWGGF